MKVSVIVSVYNTEKYLDKCLKSISAQSIDNMEIIAVNDGSSDKSLDIIKKFMKTDSRIRLFDMKNGGVSKARNIGIENARGKYFICIDSDDYIHKNMIEDLYNKAEATGSDMAVCNIVKVYGGGKVMPPMIKFPKDEVITVPENNYQFIADVFSEKKQIGGSVGTKLFKTETVLKSGVKFEERDEIYAEDAFFIMNVLKYINKAAVLDKPYYYYYQRKDSVSNTFKPNLTRRIVNYLDRLEERYCGNTKVIQAVNARAYAFLLEIMGEQIKYGSGEKEFVKEISCESIRKRIENIDVSGYSAKRKIVYYLYKYKMYKFIYYLFKILRNEG